MPKHCKLSGTTVKNMIAGSKIAKDITCPNNYKCIKKGRKKSRCKHLLNL